MTHFPRVALVSLVVVALSGCTTAAPTPESPDVIAVDAPPEAFSTRAPLESCGIIELEQGESIPQQAIDCMKETAAAELAVTSPTTEGDPIVTYYRVDARGLEIWTDSTRDQWSNSGWTLETCPDAMSIVEIGECTSG